MVRDDDDDNGWKRKRKRKRQKSCAAKALQQQEDILLQILTRLRVKSLMRFKLVCKSWMSLISDPFFINSHRHRSKSDPPEIITMKIVENSVVLMDEKGRHKSCLIPLFWTEDQNLNLKIVDNPTIVHCDGLFLIGRTAQRLLVCNPATRESVALPPTTYIPNVKYSGVGIGFDRSTSKYKVIRIFNREVVCGIEVITLGAAGNSWRQKACPQYVGFSAILTLVTVQGAAYWIFCKEYYNGTNLPDKAILRFDLSNEEFSVIDPPCPTNKLRYMTELQGHLCCSGHDEDPTIWVWLLSVDNLVGWTLRYTIHLQDPCLRHQRYMPITIDQQGCLLLKFLKHMYCYNPRTNQFYEMGSDAYAPELLDSWWCHTTSYVETIMPASI